MQALHTEDGTLPQGLMVQNVYMEICRGSKNVTVVVRNTMAYPQMLRKKIPIVRAVMATWMPESPMHFRPLGATEEGHGHLAHWLAVKERQKKLF